MGRGRGRERKKGEGEEGGAGGRGRERREGQEGVGEAIRGRLSRGTLYSRTVCPLSGGGPFPLFRYEGQQQYLGAPGRISAKRRFAFPLWLWLANTSASM